MSYRDPKTLAFIQKKHEGQVRKHTGLPYVTHAWAVADILEQFADRECLEVSNSDIDAALCHDILEDTKTTIVELIANIGVDAAFTVHMLSNWFPKTFTYKQRNELYSLQLAKAPDSDKRLKCADILHNTSDLILYEENRSYLLDKRELLYTHIRNNSLIFAAATIQVDIMLAILDSSKPKPDTGKNLAYGIQACMAQDNFYTLAHALNAVSKYAKVMDTSILLMVVRGTYPVADRLENIWHDLYRTAFTEIMARGLSASLFVGLPKIGDPDVY